MKFNWRPQDSTANTRKNVLGERSTGMKKGVTVRAHYKVRYLLVASALSMFSKTGVSTHSKVRYLKEVEVVWEMGQAIGLEADGKDEMIIQKIMELEEADDRDKDVGTEKVGPNEDLNLERKGKIGIFD
ncbi:hypothetical protein Dimus_036443 [Dionaea muscipula]